ncbi:hypothetical protein F3J28_03715 [Enterobacter sp. Ap-1006]|nr:hypothetical protein [Enterobacter sp. Ap-1006]
MLISGLTGEKYFDYASADLIKNHVSISLDGVTRDVVLTDPKTGNTLESQFRLAFFGMRHNRLDASNGHLFNAMTGTGASPSGGCSGRIGSGGDSWYTHAWGVPEAKLTCYRKLSDDGKFQGNVRIDNFSFGYNLTTPNPLAVYSGDYEGEVVYTVGEGGDINFNTETTSDSEIRIKIKATVRHAFKFFLAPGSENVSLAPKGGWSQWVNGGPVPDLLNKEVPFTLSSTSGFTVNMRCEYDVDEGCALRDSPTGEKIPLEVALTLPGFKAENGSEVRNLLLNSLPAGHVIQPPGKFVVDRRSQVDFRVRKPGVETMMKSPGSTWRGAVTLVFDTQTE